jgi:hypothetical protein
VFYREFLFKKKRKYINYIFGEKLYEKIKKKLLENNVLKANMKCIV